MNYKFAPDQLFLDYLTNREVMTARFSIIFKKIGELNGGVTFKSKVTGVCSKGRFVVCHEKYSNMAVLTIILSGATFVFHKKNKLVPPAMLIATTEDFLSEVNAICDIQTMR
jgi:hypothetical protein